MIALDFEINIEDKIILKSQKFKTENDNTTKRKYRITYFKIE